MGSKTYCVGYNQADSCLYVQNCEKSKETVGAKAVGEYFSAGCQIFPVKFFCENTSFNAIMGIINGEEIALLEQTNFSNSYLNTDFISLKDVFSVQKHKTKHLRVLILNKKKWKKVRSVIFN
jgi:hypothetical protein